MLQGKTSRKSRTAGPQLNYLGSGLRFLAPENEDPLFVNRAFDRHKSKREGVERLDAQSAELRLLAKCEKNVTALLCKVAELRKSPPPPQAQVGNRGSLTEEQAEDLRTSLAAIRMFHARDEPAASTSPRTLSPSPPKQPRSSASKASSPRAKLEMKIKLKLKPKLETRPRPMSFSEREAVLCFAAYLKENGLRSPRFMAECD